MKKTRVAINGFGRIGRTFFRMAYEDPDIEVVAINDLGDIHNLAYLLEYDTAYGRSPYRVEVKEGVLVVDGKNIIYTSEREPLNLPWGREDVDVVVESTGVFTSYEKAKVHLDAGAKRVVISAPVKNEEGESGKTVLIGVNEDALKTCSISSNASCTTNAASPLVAILDMEIGIEKAILNTVHAYTASQALVDGPSKKDREGQRRKTLCRLQRGQLLLRHLCIHNLRINLMVSLFVCPYRWALLLILHLLQSVTPPPKK